MVNRFGTSPPSLKDVFNQLSFGRLFANEEARSLRAAHLKVSALVENIAGALSEELASFRPSERIKRPSDVMGRSMYDLAALHPDGLRLTVHLGSSGAITEAIERHALDRAEASFRCEKFTAVGCREEVAEAKRRYQEGPKAGSLDAVRDLISWEVVPRLAMASQLAGFMGPVEAKLRNPLGEAAALLIDEQSSFVSTPKKIQPSSRFYGLGDPYVAAVLAGRKPAALTNASFIYQDPLGREFARRGREAGLVTFWLGETGAGRHVEEIVIGEPESVHMYAALKQAYFGHEERPLDAHYHRTMGQLLGYPESSIENFVGGRRRSL